ncbi:MAG: protein kinase domain-containing protein [Aureliella sp.]
MHDNTESASGLTGSDIRPETSPTSQSSSGEDQHERTTPDRASTTKVTDFGKSVPGERQDEDLQKPLPFKQLGKYELIEEIGQGGMGIVYRAHEKELDREVALKILPSASSLKRGQADRFSLEAKAAASLNHEHIVPIYDSGEDRGTRFYAMELIVGKPLSKVVKSARKALRSGRGKPYQDDNATVADRAVSIDTKASAFNLTEASFVSSHAFGDSKSGQGLAKSVARIGIDVARALNHAHLRGVIHRDIKPSNLLLDEQNKVWITDFGLAQLRDSPSLTQTGDVVGTLRYMSPEQAAGRRGFVDDRTDIYSLGITLYELLTLRSAYQGRNAAEILREVTFERPASIRKLNASIPRDLEAIIERAIERNPNDRYENAGDLAADLQRFVDGKKPNLRRYSVWKRTRDWLTARPAAFAGIGASAILSIVVACGAAWVLAGMLEKSDEENIRMANELRASEQARILGQAHLQANENPGLAARLTREAFDGPLEIINQVAMLVLRNYREQLTLRSGISGYPRIAIAGGIEKNQVLLTYLKTNRNDSAPAFAFDVNDGRNVAQLESDRAIDSAVFHPSLPLLITSSSSHIAYDQSTDRSKELGYIELWDDTEFKRVRSLRQFHSLALSKQSIGPKSGHIVLPTQNHRAKVVQLQPYSEIGPELVGHTDDIIQAIYSPSERFIATISFDNTVKVWDARTGNELKSFTVQLRQLESLRLEFSTDSRFLLASGNGTYILNLEQLYEEPKRLGDEIAKFIPNLDRLLTARKYGEGIREYDLGREEFVSRLETSTSIQDLDISHDGHYLVAVQLDQVEIIDLRTRKSVGHATGHEGLITDIKCSTNQEEFFTAGVDGTLRRWTYLSDEAQRTYRPSMDAYRQCHLSWSPAGNQVLLSPISSPTTLRYVLPSFERQQAGLPGTCQLVLKDGRTLTQDNGNVYVWSINWRLEDKLLNSPSSAFDKYAELVGSGSILLSRTDGSLVQWNPGKLSQKRVNLDSEVVDMVPDHANECVWIIQRDQSLLRWAGAEESYQRVHQFNNSLRRIRVSSDGSRLLLDTSDQKYLVWNVDQKELVAEWQLGSNVSVPSDEKREDVQELLENCYFASSDGSSVCVHIRNSRRASRLEVWKHPRPSSVNQPPTLVTKRDFGHVKDVTLIPARNLLAVADGARGAFIFDGLQDKWIQLMDEPAWTIAADQDNLYLSIRPSEEAIGMNPDTPASKWYAVGLRVWNYDSQSISRQIDLPSRPIRCDVSANGQSLLVSSIEHRAENWNLQNDLVTRVGTHAAPVQFSAFLNETECLTVAKDATWLISDTLGNVVNRNEPAGTGTAVDRGPSRLPHESTLGTVAITEDRRFLITTDLFGGTAKTDLATGHSSKIPLPEGAPWQHCISSDNQTVLSFNGTSVVQRWDLRSDTVEAISCEGTVFNVDMHPTKPLAILIRGDERPPVNARKLTSRYPDKNPQEEPDAWLLDLEGGKQTPLNVDGDMVDAKFSPNGKWIFLLGTEGQLEIRMVNGDKGLRIEGLVRFRYLLDSASESMVFVGSDDRTWAYDCRTGELLWELPAENVPKIESIVGLDPGIIKAAAPDVQISGKDNGWFVARTKTGFQKIPNDFRAYLNELKIRELTEAEEKRFTTLKR